MTATLTDKPAKGDPNRDSSRLGTPLARPLRLGQVLLDQGLLTEAQVEAALAAQKETGNTKLLGELVVELGYCAEDAVVAALATAYGVPFARLSPQLCDPALAVGSGDQKALLPAEFLDRSAVLPLFDVDGVLTVAMSEPSNVFVVEDIARLTGREVQIALATRTDIRDTLEQIRKRRGAGNAIDLDALFAQAQADKDAVAGRFERREESARAPTAKAGIELATAESGASLDAAEASEHSPVVKLVNHTILSAVREGASDIHFEPDDGMFRVRYRIDGRLAERLQPPYSMAAAIVARIKIMAGLDIAERRLPQDGGIRVLSDGSPVDLRVSTLPNKFGEKVVIRVIDTRNVLVRLNQIGLGERDLASLTRQITKPHGIILVTGPTGSGKSTTLYAILNEINEPDINICTVEDPVEYHLKRVNQFQVNERIGLTFPAVLRSLLRQDPDVIMVGEIRDAETAKTAVQAALTGHLVLSTLHTNDAASAVTRLHNLGVEPYLISASLEAVVAQRLVQRICAECRRPHEPTATERKLAERAGVSIDRMFRGIGCANCRHSGFKGRAGLFEVLIPNDELRDAITSGAALDTIRELAAAAGGSSLMADGLEKIARGDTTLDEVLRVTTG